MAVYSISALKSRINQYIKQNFNQEITGTVAQGIFQDVVDSLNALIEVITPIEKKHFNQALTEGENTISFSTSFSIGSTYTLTWNCYNADGMVNYRPPTNRELGGFKIIVDADCTIEGVAIKI